MIKKKKREKILMNIANESYLHRQHRKNKYKKINNNTEKKIKLNKIKEKELKKEINKVIK